MFFYKWHIIEKLFEFSYEMNFVLVLSSTLYIHSTQIWTEFVDTYSPEVVAPSFYCYGHYKTMLRTLFGCYCILSWQKFFWSVELIFPRLWSRCSLLRYLPLPLELFIWMPSYLDRLPHLQLRDFFLPRFVTIWNCEFGVFNEKFLHKKN